MGACLALVWAAVSINVAQAQTTDTTPPQDPVEQTRAAADPQSPDIPSSDVPAKRWRYTVGLKLKTYNLADASTSLVLRPVLGLRYGRWRLGHATGDEWLQFSGYRKEANLAYELRDQEGLKVDLSLRIQNLQDNSSFDGFSSGKNTLRGRVSINYRLNERWSLGTDLTQDLMDRGDGTTLSGGLSYNLPLSTRSALSLSTGDLGHTRPLGHPDALAGTAPRRLATRLGFGRHGARLPLRTEPAMGLVWHPGHRASHRSGRGRAPQRHELVGPNWPALLQPITLHATCPLTVLKLCKPMARPAKA